MASPQVFSFSRPEALNITKHHQFVQPYGRYGHPNTWMGGELYYSQKYVRRAMNYKPPLSARPRKPLDCCSSYEPAPLEPLFGEDQHVCEIWSPSPKSCCPRPRGKLLDGQTNSRGGKGKGQESNTSRQQQQHLIQMQSHQLEQAQQQQIPPEHVQQQRIQYIQHLQPQTHQLQMQNDQLDEFQEQQLPPEQVQQQQLQQEQAQQQHLRLQQIQKQMQLERWDRIRQQWHENQVAQQDPQLGSVYKHNTQQASHMGQPPYQPADRPNWNQWPA